jgi:hypothetical protein
MMYSGNWTLFPSSLVAMPEGEALLTVSFYGTGIYIQGKAGAVSAPFA